MGSALVKIMGKGSGEEKKRDGRRSKELKSKVKNILCSQ
jgi:hypothetical protein